jgi:UDP-N-acetylglucosamine:LPS N-acetylglucosamine transferase
LNIDVRQKRILLAPLDWGLGHTTRCIALLHWLLHENNKVTVACNHTQKAILAAEFSNINFLHLEGYNIRYSQRKRLLPLVLFFQIPVLLLKIRKEKYWLKRLLEEKKFDLIISDNRYGLYNTQVESVFMTHQLHIMTPSYLTAFVRYINYYFIEKFSKVWVPDDAEKPGLAGQLSHPRIVPQTPIQYIGPLSRFGKIEKRDPILRWLIILSGPEPQRTILEKKIVKWLERETNGAVLLRGLPLKTDSSNLQLNAPHIAYNHLPSEKLKKVLAETDYVISRSGYTTVMELLPSHLKCIFIPTPGQTEQEYLAMHLMKQKKCFSFSQDADFTKNIQQAELFFETEFDKNPLSSPH